MTTTRRYAIPVEDSTWAVRNAFDTVFRWEYEEGRAALMNLYEKGKKLQWNTNARIDWSQNLDPENPQELPDESVSIFGSPMWERLTRQEKATLRRHLQAWQLSQFLHGEQGALVCTAKIVQQVPSVDAKFYAATQVMDEARHVETYSRLLHEKFDLAYPITPTLKRLLADGLSASRWDMTYLGMQVLREGLALAAFANIRDQAKNSLAAAVNAYVMQDEARHVAFGRLTLRDYYPQLTQAERDEREEFAVEACYLMRDRFLSEEVWETVGLPVEECVGYVESSQMMRQFRSLLFSRIVPTIKDIGLWGPKIRRAYSNMGIIGFADVDTEQLTREDERGQACREQQLLAATDAPCIVAGRPPAAQDDVPVGVALGVDHGGDAILVDAEEGVRMARRLQRVDGDLLVAVGRVLEADRHREPARHLAMRLALGGARADRGPRDQVGQVLRRDRVEQLGAGGQPEPRQIDEQLAGQAQPELHVVRAVEVGVVDEPLPADRRARLLEVDAPHDEELVRQPFGEGAEPPGVVERRLRVVDRARADYGEETAVPAGNDVANGRAGAHHHLVERIRARQLALDDARRDQGLGLDDVEVLGAEHRVRVSGRRRPGQAPRPSAGCAPEPAS